MNEEDKKRFLEDFTKADVKKKLDMWYYALEHEMLWGEILAEMADTAQKANIKPTKMTAKS